MAIFCESAESNPGYVRDIVMYITYLQVRWFEIILVRIGRFYIMYYKSGMLEVLEWILFDFYHITLNLSIYPGYVRDIVMYITSLEEVCWLFLCEIVINSVMYITSVFSVCWWYFQRLSCGQLFDIFVRVLKAILDMFLTLLCI